MPPCSAHRPIGLALLPLIFFSLMIASASRADITLDAGYTIAAFSPAKDWGIASLHHRGLPIMTYSSSANGFVVQFDGGDWAGEGHGLSYLESTHLTVDGVPTEIVDGTHYRGTTLLLRRVVLLRGALRVFSTIAVSPDGVDETYAMARVGTIGNLERVYGPAATRTNRFTVVELRQGDEAIASETVDRDDWLFFRPPVESRTADTLLQWDPIFQDGVLTRWTGDPTAVWVWDRRTDNKIYVVADEVQTNASPFSISVSTRFCRGDACDAPTSP